MRLRELTAKYHSLIASATPSGPGTEETVFRYRLHSPDGDDWPHPGLSRSLICRSGERARGRDSTYSAARFNRLLNHLD
jgi:hypothetical protein